MSKNRKLYILVMNTYSLLVLNLYSKKKDLKVNGGE